MHCPTNILQIAVVKKGIAVEFHPHSNLFYTDGPDFCYWVTIKRRNQYIIDHCQNAGGLWSCIIKNIIILLHNIKVIYRYLWTNTPLKIAFIMFSISSWFSCSWNKKHTFKIRRVTFGQEVLVKWVKCDIQLRHRSVVVLQLTQVQRILTLYNLTNWMCRCVTL